MKIIGLSVAGILLLAACSGALPSSPPAPEITDEPIVLSPPYTGPLELLASDEPSEQCERESPFSLPAAGVIPLGFLPNRKCAESNYDLDLFEAQGRVYAAQRNHRGFRLVDVTDPALPTEVGLWLFEPRAGTGHIKAFHQSDRRYLAVTLESPSPYTVTAAPCGLLIVEVTQPSAPVVLGRYDGTSTGSAVPWCNIHSVEVDYDADGNAAHLLAATPNTADLRLLDIRDLGDIRDVGAFHLHDHPHGGSGSWAHRASILGDRVYVANWNGGVAIVDWPALKAGAGSASAMLNPPGSIDPAGYTAHDSQPTADGNFLFVNDMERAVDGLRLYDIRDPAHPREVWVSDFAGTDTGNHTLQRQGDLLFVPWFRQGLRVFRFDLGDPDRPIIEQVAFQSVRTPPYSSSDGGVSEVRVRPCETEGIARTCIYASDEELGLIILALDDN